METRLSRPIKTVPHKCNILGVSYRTVSTLIALLLLIQNVSFIISFGLKSKIPCTVFMNGIYSLFIQFGDGYWPLIGLSLAMLGLATNTALLMGTIMNIQHLILLWYLGSISQFVYLLSLQSFCFSTESCYSNCGLNEEGIQNRPWGFGWSLFLTLYLYVTFMFKIQLFYSYAKYVEQIRRLTSRDEVILRLYRYLE